MKIERIPATIVLFILIVATPSIVAQESQPTSAPIDDSLRTESKGTVPVELVIESLVQGPTRAIVIATPEVRRRIDPIRMIPPERNENAKRAALARQISAIGLRWRTIVGRTATAYIIDDDVSSTSSSETTRPLKTMPSERTWFGGTAKILAENGDPEFAMTLALEMFTDTEKFAVMASRAFHVQIVRLGHVRSREIESKSWPKDLTIPHRKRIDFVRGIFESTGYITEVPVPSDETPIIIVRDPKSIADAVTPIELKMVGSFEIGRIWRQLPTNAAVAVECRFQSLGLSDAALIFDHFEKYSDLSGLILESTKETPSFRIVGHPFNVERAVRRLYGFDTAAPEEPTTRPTPK